MPPANKRTAPTTPPPAPDAVDPAVDPAVDTTTVDDTGDDYAGLPEDVDVDSWVEWQLPDGSTGHGIVTETISETDDRDAGVRVIPFPPAVHIPASALLYERED